MLEDFFEWAFIPSSEILEDISELVTDRFSFIDTIRDFIDDLKDMFNLLNPNATLSYNVNSKYYNGDLTIIDLSWYAPYKQYGDIIITGFIYIFFLWRLYIHIPNIIHGTGGDAVEIKGGFKQL